ncbi:hypothetical protein REPUB_Repub17cG0171300 [Reevesia pubescens]
MGAFLRLNLFLLSLSLFAIAANAHNIIAILEAPSASSVNITSLLYKVGCKTFASLLASSGVLKIYESALDKGLTIFAPSDEAFKAKGVPNMSKLTNAEQVSLLEFHASPDYKPKGTLKMRKYLINTLATNGVGKFDLTVTNDDDSVTLHTIIGPSRIAETIFDSPSVVIFTVNNILLPVELFGKSSLPAPAPKLVSSPSPTPFMSPSPSAPPPLVTSPPTNTRAGSPVDTPARSSENSNSDNVIGHVSAHLLRTVIFIVFATCISSILLS